MKTKEATKTISTAEAKKEAKKELSAYIQEMRTDTEAKKEFEQRFTDKNHVCVATLANSIFSISDERNNTVVIAYDIFRLQFTVENARKYKDIVFAENAKYKDRFYTHYYRQTQEFISIKAIDKKDLFEILDYIIKIDNQYRKSQINEAKKTTTVAKKKATKKEA